jgi:hypothetical protein
MFHSASELNKTDILISWVREAVIYVNYFNKWSDYCGIPSLDPFQWLKCLPPVPTKEELKKKFAAGFISNCNAIHRKKFYLELKDQVHVLTNGARFVENYGKCETTPGLSSDSVNDKLEKLKMYN